MRRDLACHSGGMLNDRGDDGKSREGDGLGRERFAAILVVGIALAR